MSRFNFFFLTCLTYTSFSQCPDAIFTTDKEAFCIDEPIDFTNVSLDGERFYWDFCAGDLDLVPSAFLQLDGVGNPFEVEIVKQGTEYFGFVTSRAQNTVYRIDFGASLDNINPQLVDLNISESNLLSIEIVEENNEWIGLIQTFDNKLFRLEFGSDLTNEPVKIDLGSFSEFNNPIDLEILEFGANKIGFIANFRDNRLLRLNFNGSFFNSPTIESISVDGANVLGGISFVQDCENGYMYVSSSNNNSIFEVAFGSDILSPSPIIRNLGVTVPTGRGLCVVEDFGEYYLFVQSGGGDVYKISFGDNLGTLNPVLDNLGNFGVLGTQFGFSMYSDSSRWFGFSSVNGSGSNIYQLSFPNDCDLNTVISSSFEPIEVVYGSSGQYIVGLRVENSDGNTDIFRDTVDVSSSVAPPVSFTIDENRCISNSNTFTPSSSDFTSYSWDFNNDGIEDSDEENPTFNYSLLGAGEYTVRLDISSGDCDNFYEQEITIFPNPPDPTFLINSSSSFCTNNELFFVNTTDETGYDNILTYQWFIDGEEFNTKDASYIFTSDGSKSITLQAFLPGCSSSVSEQSITIAEGPSVDFSYTNNCFGSAIEFRSEVFGSGITEYQWEFGDGIGSSTNENPTYQYSTAGMFEVTLTVKNDEGCETIYSEELIVNDQSLLDFSVSNTVENLPVMFQGQDLTSPNDSVITWIWNFAGLGTSNEQNSTFTFPQGEYEITLSIQTAQGCEDQIINTIRIDEALCPSTIFTIGDKDICIGQPVFLENQTVNADKYLWDFCLGDLTQNPSASLLLNEIGNPFEVEIVKDKGQYYGFVSSREDNTIYRLDFGTNLGNQEPGITNLDVNEENLLGVELVMQDNEWFGFVQSFDNKLYRLEFGADIESIPLKIDLGEFEGFSGAADLEIIELNSNKIGFVTNFNNNNLIRLDFNESYLNVPSTESIPVIGASSLGGISTIRSCENWYAYVSSSDNNSIFEIDFGDNLMSSVPNIRDLGITIPAGRGLSILNEFDRYFLFVQSGSGDVYRVSFDGGLENSDLVVNNLGNFGLLSTQFGFSIYSDSSKWYGFSSINGSGSSIYQLEFPNECEVNVFTSNEFEPKGINFSSSGEYIIGLRSENSNGGISFFRDTLIVNNLTAPIVSFDIDESRCILTSNTFSLSTSFTSYSWDFNSDGIEDSNLENPTFDFSTLGIGSYTVRLDVNDGTCSNFAEQEITIYPEPPTPSFTPSSLSECPNTELIFTNNTDESQHMDVISYEWDFDNDGIVDSTDPNPVFSYATAGSKTVSVTSIIPGCESSASTVDITINEGPVANFFANSVCQNDATQFTNTSENGVSYLWDFGDGFTSTAENPSHLFESAGNYDVTLVTTNAEGCEDTEIIEVVVSEIPQVDFDFDIPCNSMEGTAFFDLTTVVGADVVSWSWRVNDIEVSTLEDPDLVFEESGVSNVTLVVTSSNGCESTYSEDIEILESPTPDFSSTIGCQGLASTFSDVTVSEGNQIVSWLWTVDETIYNTRTVEHVFEAAGNYEVTLEVTGQNFCSESITRTVEVLQLPASDFTVDGDCDNVIVSAQDQSTAVNDPIVSRRWMLDGQSVGDGSELFLSSLSAGSYDLELEVESSSGCIISSNQTLEINSAPTSSFTFDTFFGIPGDMISFTNTSLDASSYQWLLNGTEISTSSTTQNYLFEEAGDYQVSLVSTNDAGCSDTINQIVNIAIPEVDLIIRGFDLVEEGSTGRIFLEIENQSNLPVDVTQATIELENQLSVTEDVELLINVGETRLVGLDVGIPLAVRQPTYFCVTLSSQYQGYEDINPVDNEKCLTIEPSIVIEDPFPNPVRDQFRLKLVAPSSGQVNIRLINSSGKLELEEVFDTISGLNNFFLDMTTLYPGTYFVVVEMEGQRFERRVIKI